MIKKYRKKPVVVDAFQFFYDNPGTLEWVKEALERRIIDFDYLGNLYIKTLEGNELVSDGDYIIRGVKGEFYPCKPDVFEQTYEEADKPHRTCNICAKTDGVTYTSSPPMVRCTVDGKYHTPDFECILNLDAGVTNADRIRAMSDEELAVEIVRKEYTPPCFMWVPKMRDFDHCDGRCTSGVTKWLQQPAEEE